MLITFHNKTYGVGWLLAIVRMSLVLKLWPRSYSGSKISGLGHCYSYYLRHCWIQLRIVDNRHELAVGRSECIRLLRIIRQAERRMNWHCPEPLEADIKRRINVYDIM